ncbi:Leucine-, isoleucine-, valine-, threonine-, and alanine-binding protein [Caenispirillum salinarum AK4]|uniref:Leucine-, isoleucine-, valine-, threonine-, and alanine-binding protein n=1 Tax=Caenispirillum salinarum AK4 TaxID=1238182 RepID=K9HPI7_9PROT|nr:ABC transporter substrate-binding protein [Caenispirillum salinarum]EKV30416.1 Leucine-, isoleucine-, valine-, threonine-, and alanine-binding protein [Caenispirillum salinarum AK4]
MTFNMKISAAAIALAVGVSGTLLAEQAKAQDAGQYVPGTVYRSGPYAPGGIPWANGYADYFKLLNERDGGIGGVPIIYEECDTAYSNDKGVECYEKMKNQGPTGASVFQPLSTGITYALIDRVKADEIPMITSGLGRADASDGTVFPWVFTLPVTYWAGADAIVQYIDQQEEGSLDGKTIALVYHDSAYGKEPINTLEYLAEKHGFKLELFPVAHPGLEQKATWLKIGRQIRPDWTIMWGWGVMNSTAIKEAAAVGYPMDRFIGNWWAGSEVDVKAAGGVSKGYLSAQFHGAGEDFKVLDDVKKHLVEKDLNAGPDEEVGDILYNRGLISAVFTAEGIAKAQEKYGQKPLTGEQIRWGIENINLDEARLEELGLTGLLDPVKLSCADHEGGGSVIIQQWDGENWKPVSDWISPARDEYLRDMYEKSAADYAAEKGIEPRDCSKES